LLLLLGLVFVLCVKVSDILRTGIFTHHFNINAAASNSISRGFLLSPICREFILPSGFLQSSSPALIFYFYIMSPLISLLNIIGFSMPSFFRFKKIIFFHTSTNTTKKRLGRTHMEKGISVFHLTMMGLGTVIGASFFLGSAIAIHAAGPSVIISYMIGGALVYIILYSLSEMTVADLTPGSFRAFAKRAYGQGLGFVVGWVYWTGLVLGMSSEAIAASTLIRSWFPGISVGLLGTIVIIAITLVNLLGAERLSKLESGLSAVKLLAVIGFIVIGIALIAGFFPGNPAVGMGEVAREPFFAGGLAGLGGSMMMVMSTYAGFEIIGLAASEAKNPKKTVPRAILFTVILLIGLYIGTIAVMLPLIPTRQLNESVSPIVAALSRQGIGWAANSINFILVTAILSTLLATIFGLGRMIRSLADEGLAPEFIKEKGNIPYRGILMTGAGMLVSLGLGLLLPANVYTFLVSSGAFAMLFTYAVIVASHMRFRRENGCSGACQLPGYPYTSWFALVSLVIIILCMPFVEGQGAGLAAGLMLVVIFTGTYQLVKLRRNRLAVVGLEHRQPLRLGNLRPGTAIETSEELLPNKQEKE
jgi:L-asparagine transporter-like permease